MASFSITALVVGILSAATGITMEKYGVTGHIPYYLLGVGTVLLCNVICLVLGKKAQRKTITLETHSS